jgi:hypothetical protein
LDVGNRKVKVCVSVETEAKGWSQMHISIPLSLRPVANHHRR